MKRERVSDEFVDIGGDELTRLKKKVYRGDVAEGFRKFAEKHRSSAFVDKLGAISVECDAILKALNLPAAGETVGVNAEGNWVPIAEAKDPVTGKRRPEYGSYTGAAYVLETATTFSEAWYAAKIGELCWLIEKAPNPSDSVFLMNTLELGRWLEDRSWRLRHKPSILTGRSVRKGAQEGGRIRSRSTSLNTRRVLKAMTDRLESNPKVGVKRAAELVFAKGVGTSAEANRQLWYANKPK